MFERVADGEDLQEEVHFVPRIPATKGTVEPSDTLRGSTVQFFKAEPPMFEKVDDTDGLVKEATQMKFFQQEKPMRGEIEEQNSFNATEQEFFDRDRAIFGNDVEAPHTREDVQEQLFN